MNREQVVAELGRIAPVLQDEPLSRHTSFRIGGPADLYVAARNAEQLRDLVQRAIRLEVPFMVLGAGSNSLVGDGGIRNLVINNLARHVRWEESLEGSVQAYVESGMIMATLAKRAQEAGLSGVEWAIGIPGTVGGAVMSNAGAYTGDVAAVLREVGMVDARGEEVRWTAEQLRLNYRSSALAEARDAGLAWPVVLWARLGLQPGDTADIAQRMSQFNQHRRYAQPAAPSAGSIFKNPPDRSAWQVVEAVGLRGHRIGDAQFSIKHSNFIINRGKARAADVMALIRLAQERAYQQFGIRLELEVRMVGDFQPEEDSHVA